jgi:hypothetical protein
METHMYLCSTVNAQAGCEKDVKNRIKIAWQKWRELTEGVLCDSRMPTHLKATLYKTMLRPVLIYVAEAWNMTVPEEGLPETAEVRMLRWMLGITLNGRKKNDHSGKKRSGMCDGQSVRTRLSYKAVCLSI